MEKTKRDALFERLLAEPDQIGPEQADPEQAGHDPALHAALAAALERAGSDASNGNDTAKLAAYLDGTLDAQEAEAFIAALLNAPGEIHDLEAAQAFLDTLGQDVSAAPPELVAAAVDEAERKTAVPLIVRRWKSAPRLRQWALAGSAIAAVLLVFTVDRHSGTIPVAPPSAPAALAAAQANSPAQPAPQQQAQLTPPKEQPEPLPAPAPAEAKAAQPSTSQPVPQQQAPEQLAQAEPSVKALRLPLPVPLLAAPPPPPAAAPTQEDVLVTGSLITGTAAVGVPVTRFSADAGPAYYRQSQNTEKYPDAKPNAVKIVRDEPVSTFSADVDTASYANVRRFLNQGTLPPADAVRVEEMINYFAYDYAVPKDRSAPFEPTVAVYPTPWNPDTKILHIGIKGFDLPKTERPRANLVFLIDSSGSMAEPNKLPLLKRSFRLLVDQLRPEDRVSIVTYAGRVGIVLPPTPGSDKAAILDALDGLDASGSTAGGEGIKVAYRLAEENFDKTGVNRVLLATDGDFNVGITDPNALEDFVTRQRASGVYLSVLGFGADNYDDLLMQKLAQAGNGNAAYIDTLNEAQKVFVDQLAGTLFTIAKDVKIQVEFNPARVAEYRLIGYETRLLANTDFNNDKVDAGDIGSGHTVTALYEITPVGSKAQLSDPLRYGQPAAEKPAGDELAYVKIRYKLPAEDDSRLITRAVTDRDVQPDFSKLPADLRFAASVAGAAQLLRHDPAIKSFDYAEAIGMAQAAKGDDPFGYRTEFVQLLRLAQSAAKAGGN